MPTSSPRHALLLAAGAGSRLRPLTDRVPKPLLPIDGRPVVSTLIEQLDALGVDALTVVVGPHGGLLREHLEQAVPAGATLRFVEQPQPRGSADALQRALGVVDRDAVTFVAACDTVWVDGDLARVARCHAEHAPLVTMAARRWPLEQLPHHSCLALDDAGRVERVLATPDAGTSSALSGSPLYVFDPGVWAWIERVEPGSSGVLELATALQAAIDAGEHVHACEVRPTRDLTRPDDLLRHNFPYLAALLPELPTGA